MFEIFKKMFEGMAAGITASIETFIQAIGNDEFLAIFQDKLQKNKAPMTAALVNSLAREKDAILTSAVEAMDEWKENQNQ